MKIIGVEEHYNPTVLIDYLRSKQTQDLPPKAPFESGRLLMERRLRSMISSMHLPEEKRLEEMKEAGIDMQVLSVGLMVLNFMEPSEGTALSRQIDDEMAEVVKKYPGKFAGLAAIAPRAPEAAADELERAVKKLGFKGAMINSHVNGEYLDEEKFWVILERAASLGVPIYIHPNQPSPDMEKPYLKYPQLLDALWGFAAETGLHAMRLICSGVFDRYPDLKIILGHMGESLPFWLWRMDRHWRRDQSGDGITQLQRKPSEYIRDHFYVTTSGMFWPTVIQFGYLALGADRILFGVDYPLESNTLAVEAVKNTPICDSDKEKIFHLNAERIFKL